MCYLWLGFLNRMLPVRHPKEMPSFASHVLEWAGPGGCPQPAQPQRGPILTPRWVLQGKTARVAFSIPQTSQEADGGENPSSQFLLD